MSFSEKGIDLAIEKSLNFMLFEMETEEFDHQNDKI